MPALALLGPQRFTPTLGEAVGRAGVTGRLASVTAGWQEREAEDLELHEHLGERTENLMLYARSEDVFEQDHELEQAYRERQEGLRALQEIYRGRLAHALSSLREIENRAEAVANGGDAAHHGFAPDLLAEEIDSSMSAMRDLDAHHESRIAAVHRDFETRMRLESRPSIERHARQIDRQLARAEGVAIAGGHVAILLNRLRLFDIGRRIAEKAIFAWSAGAMAIAERVVVFHHFPPQGQGITELLEIGLGLARGVVPLPHAHRRLALDDPERLSRVARRFAPAICVAMSDGGCLERLGDGTAWTSRGGMSRIEGDGTVTEIDGFAPGRGA
jgi:hypothetical protein